MMREPRAFGRCADGTQGEALSEFDATHGGAAPRPHPDVIAQRMEDEMVLVHLGTNHIYSLNQTGARAWELLAEGHGPDGIQRTMLDEFDVVETELSAEIDGFLSTLQTEGLVDA